MKQAFQDARSAAITVVEVPAPKLLAGCVLVRTAASLVSAGTERAASEFAGKNLLQKARMRPDLVREVLSKISRDGFVPTISAVRSRLDQPLGLGYSSAGTVVAVGEGVTGFNPGDRVACAGAGHAVHAEFACIPRLLTARIPSETVSFDEAAFTTVGAVALHGIRTADVKLRRCGGSHRTGSAGSTDRADSERGGLLPYSEWIFPTSAPTLRCGLARTQSAHRLPHLWIYACNAPRDTESTPF